MSYRHAGDGLSVVSVSPGKGQRSSVFGTVDARIIGEGGQIRLPVLVADVQACVQ